MIWRARPLNNSNAKKGAISPYQLFFIFLVSRAVVALTFYQSILINGISSDSLISSALSLGINLLLCLPAYFCFKNKKNPLETKLGKVLYLAYFLFFACVNISRFAFFASDKSSRGTNALLFIIIMAGAACYAAYLKIEAAARFSVICAMLSILVLIVIMLLNIRNFHITNFMPFFVGSRDDILKNALVFSSNSIEPALFLALCNKCESNQPRSLFLGIGASYLAIILMLLFCVGVMGSAASLFSFPIYTLFQMTAFRSFSRLDIVYTAFGFFALFAKCAVIILCASECITFKVKSEIKSGALFVFLCAASALLYQQFFNGAIKGARWLYFALTVIFAIVTPLIYLLFMRRKSNENG
jgi:spore germination protein KB